MLLSQLKPGDVCLVDCLLGDSILKQRMMTMGIVPGVKIIVQKFAPLGDPIEIKVRSANLSLRKQEAQTVKVSLVS